MSLENLKEIMDKSEAVTNYPKVREENTEFEHKVKNLQHQNRRLRKENSKLKDLRVKFDGKEISLEKFEVERQDYTRKFYGDELERKARERFEAESQALALKELDRFLNLPREKRPQTLNSRLDIDVNTEVDQVLKTPSSWPQWFKQSIEGNIGKEVGNRLNDIYWANVQEGVRKAKEEEWNPYLDRYLREKITPFCNAILLGRFIPQLTNQQIALTCKQCKTQWIIQLNREGITNLLEKGVTVFACSTPNCIEGIINRHPTHIHFYLGDAISMLLGKPHMPLY